MVAQGKGPAGPDDFDDYLRTLLALLRAGPRRGREILGELRDHLASRLEELEQQGVPRGEAISRALEELGDAAELAAEFSRITRERNRRGLMRLLVKSTVVVVPLVLLAWSLWPLNRQLPMSSVEAQFGGPVADSAEGGADAATDPEADELRRNAETLRKLSKRTEADYMDTPLDTVLAHLAETVDVQFHVDRRALDPAGVALDSPVSLGLKDVPADMILELALEECGLAYYLRQGVVMVTITDDMENHLMVRVYDVSEIADTSNTRPSGFGLALGGGGGFFSVASGDEQLRAEHLHECQFGGGSGGMGGGGEAESKPVDEVTELAQLIQTVVAPESWDEVGGPASIIPYRNTLVISQTFPLHAKIESVLRQLRATEGARQSRPRQDVEPYDGVPAFGAEGVGPEVPAPAEGKLPGAPG